MQLNERAELWRRGLVSGYRTVEEAIAWADAEIEANPTPPLAIIDLALVGRKAVDDAIAILEPFTTGIEASDLLSETIADMRGALAQDRSRARAIADDLFGMALRRLFRGSADIPEVWSARYAFDPEEADWAPSGEEAIQYLRETLEKLEKALAAAL